MEILKRILQDLLFYALDSHTVWERSKMWLRKRMVLKLFDEMDKKVYSSVPPGTAFCFLFVATSACPFL